MQPKVILLDAVGTLFGVRNSVGHAYRDIAANFGVNASASKLNHAFYQSFQSAGNPIFASVEVSEIPLQEYEWWRAIARQTFHQVGVLDQFQDFELFFEALYNYFATAAPWVIYPEVLPTLEYWHRQGIDLGVLSNFDSRLHTVLSVLELADFFTTVTISSEVGAAKPSLGIFTAALQKHRCAPELACHVGDSFREDYQGALSAGLQAIWLRRRE